MKKFFLLFVISLLTLNMAFAAGSGGNSPETLETGAGIDSGVDDSGQAVEDPGQGAQTETETVTQNQGENAQIQTQIQTQTNSPGAGEPAGTQAQVQASGKVQSGSYNIENGKKLEVKALNNAIGVFQLKSGEAYAQTYMEMTQEQTKAGTKLQVKLSNGKGAEVKVMPDTASKRAIERLQLKNCVAEQGCTLELKEVGSGEQVKAAYEVKAEKDAKVLGMFKTRMHVEAQIDAETGEVIQSHKPWWAFLATE